MNQVVIYDPPWHRGVRICLCGECSLKFLILRTYLLLEWRDRRWGSIERT